MRTEGLFDVPKDRTELAAEVIERIRTDERIHVESLRLYLGEIRSIHFKSESEGLVEGQKIIDRFWNNLIGWATGDQPKLAAKAAYEPIRDRILATGKGSEKLLSQFDNLSDVDFQAAAGG